MATSLRISNIPAYISEAEFKRIWSEPGLELQNLTFTKTATGENVGFAFFTNPQAAERARGMYQGWQGYGNDGLKIDLGIEGPPNRLKREREDVGGEDQAFKQGRIMGASNMGYAGGAMGNFGNVGANPHVPHRGNEPPGFSPSPVPASNQPGGVSAALGQPAPQPQPQPHGNPSFAGPQGARPGFMPQGPQGIAGQGPQPTSGPPNLQAYNQGGSFGFSAGSQLQGYNLNPAQRQANVQQPFGGQDPGPGAQQVNPYGRPQPMVQQPQPQGQPGVGPHSAQYNPANGPGYLHGPGGPGFNDPQAAAQGYDPSKPQLAGGQQQISQQHQQLQPIPQQMASLANVLGPLLQQPGMPNLSNINLSSLLAQGAAGNLPQPQVNPQQQPMHGQLQAVPQAQQQVQQMMGAVQQPQPQGLQAQGAPPHQIETLPVEAAETLYVDNMTMDVTRREMAHVFRPFEGFKDMRIVEKKDKHGAPLVIGFAEFETAHQAHAALKTLQGYPLDMTKPTENLLRISFAKPLKASDPRSRGQATNRPYNPPNMAAGRGNDRPRGDRGGGGGGHAGPAGRNDRDRRDRDRNGPRGGGDRKQGHDDRRPGQDNRRRY